MPSLLDTFYDTQIGRQHSFVEPRHTRSNNRVIVTVCHCTFSVPLDRLDDAIELATELANQEGVFSDGFDTLQALCDELLRARCKFGHLIDGRSKLRGRHEGNSGLYYSMKYLAAWTYVFLEHELKKPVDKRLPAIVSVEKVARNRFAGWNRAGPFTQRVFLTSLVVEKHFQMERRQEGLRCRTDPDNFRAKQYYRDYIRTYLRNVQRIIKNDPERFHRLGYSYLRTAKSAAEHLSGT